MEIFNTILEQIDKEQIDGIALMGSYSTGKQKVHSDIDIVLFTSQEKEIQILLIQSKLVVISTLTPKTIEAIFSEPHLTSELIFGLRYMKPLWDPNQYLIKVQSKALPFKWDQQVQKKANIYACQEMVLLIEDVNKGLQSLLTKDNGRALNCVFAMSYGLGKIIRTQKGILLKSDNALFEQLIDNYKGNDVLTNYITDVFGVSGLPLNKRVISGLLLFKHVAHELSPLFTRHQKQLLKATTNQIEKCIKEIKS